MVKISEHIVGQPYRTVLQHSFPRWTHAHHHTAPPYGSLHTIFASETPTNWLIQTPAAAQLRIWWMSLKCPIIHRYSSQMRTHSRFLNYRRNCEIWDNWAWVEKGLTWNEGSVGVSTSDWGDEDFKRQRFWQVENWFAIWTVLPMTELSFVIIAPWEKFCVASSQRLSFRLLTLSCRWRCVSTDRMRLFISQRAWTFPVWRGCCHFKE